MKLRDLILLPPFFLLTYLIYEWTMLANWTGQRDHWGMFWQAAQTYGLDFWLGKVSVLGKGSFGSAALLHYVIYLPFIITGVYLAQWWMWRHDRDFRIDYVWTRPLWLALTFGIVFVGVGVAAYAHFGDFYTIREALLLDGTVVKIQPIESVVDVQTHFWTVAMLTASLANVNLMDLFKWTGRGGRLKEFALQVLLVQLIMWLWELGEFGRPSAYANPPWNSLSDVWIGTVASLLILLAYNLIVPFEE